MMQLGVALGSITLVSILALLSVWKGAAIIYGQTEPKYPSMRDPQW